MADQDRGNRVDRQGTLHLSYHQSDAVIFDCFLHHSKMVSWGRKALEAGSPILSRLLVASEAEEDPQPSLYAVRFSGQGGAIYYTCRQWCIAARER